MRVGATLGVVVAAVLSSATANGYDQPVHVILSTRAYGGPQVLPPGDASAPQALRERIWRAGAEASDPALKKRFLARYPSLDRFDAWAFKELLGLNPEKKVAGIDDALPTGDSGAAVYGLGSRLPDDEAG